MTVHCYFKQARAFLAALPGASGVALRELGTARVTAFMVDYCQGRNPWSAKAMVTSLRAFLRFAHATGRTPAPLAGAVPAVAGWRLAEPPRGGRRFESGRRLSFSQVAAFDAASPVFVSDSNGEDVTADGRALVQAYGFGGGCCGYESEVILAQWSGTSSS